MAGGGSRKDDSSVVLSTNVFAALGSSKKKKKKSDKTKSGAAEPENEVYWTPAPLNVKSWADVDDEDDDDYFATTAPPELSWAGETNEMSDVENEEAEHVELNGDMMSESDEEGVDDVDEDDHEDKVEVAIESEMGKKLGEATTTAPKDTERQLSKKELKKKGLEELDAVLAELGLGKNETSGHDESRDLSEEKNGVLDKKEITGESKSAKKKKKKEKSLKESKESQDQPDVTGNAEPEGNTEAEKVEDTSTGDVKERLKKMASMKKKKSSKEMDAAARAAASEAAARNARQASSKKKEKNHYNQQPVR